jgi:L-asparaginase
MTVRVLGTGGTIAASLTDGTLKILAIADLCNGLPKDLPAFEAFDIRQLPSSALQPADMLDVAREVCRCLQMGSEGVVVAHGTDTLELTAFLTDLLLGDDSQLGAVVFTGAMRYASESDTDGPQNLADAIRLAGSPAARGVGVLVSFAGEIRTARWTTKTDTTSLRPFASPPGEVVGHVEDTEVTLSLSPLHRWPRSDRIEHRVALVKVFPGMERTAVDALVDDRVRGIVIEGFGVMNVPNSIIGAIGEAVERGVSVVLASRSLTVGGLDQGPVGHRHLHDLGAVGSYGLSADKAWVALMVGLERTDGTPDGIRSWLKTITESAVDQQERADDFNP